MSVRMFTDLAMGRRYHGQDLVKTAPGVFHAQWGTYCCGALVGNAAMALARTLRGPRRSTRCLEDDLSLQKHGERPRFPLFLGGFWVLKGDFWRLARLFGEPDT